MHVPKEQRSKLDSKATPCIFVGYGDEFGYRLWDPHRKTIVRSRDVVFHEHETMGNLHNMEMDAQMPIGIMDSRPHQILANVADDGR